MELTNHVRTYVFLARIFEGQQNDPYCGVCKARVNSVANARESLAAFESAHAAEIGAMPAEFRQMLDAAKHVLAGLQLPENAAGQKKAGNCKLPEGVCFVKASLSFLQKM